MLKRNFVLPGSIILVLAIAFLPLVANLTPGFQARHEAANSITVQTFSQVLGDLANKTIQSSQAVVSNAAAASDPRYPKVDPEDLKKIKDSIPPATAALTTALAPGCRSDSSLHPWLFHTFMGHASLSQWFGQISSGYNGSAVTWLNNLLARNCFNQPTTDSLIELIDKAVVRVLDKIPASVDAVTLVTVVNAVVDDILAGVVK